MLKSNRLKSLIISLFATFALILGMLAFMLVPKTQAKEASAASTVELTLSADPPLSSATKLNVKLSVKNNNSNGLGAIVIIIKYDATVFSIAEDDATSLGTIYSGWVKAQCGLNPNIRGANAGYLKVVLMCDDDIMTKQFDAITMTFNVNNPSTTASYNFTILPYGDTASPTTDDDFDIYSNSEDESYVGSLAVLNNITGLQFRTASTDASLSSLKVNNTEVISYLNGTECVIPSSVIELNYPGSSVTVAAVATDSKRKSITTSGTVTYASGTATLGTINNAVKVVPEAGGSGTTYTIKINRKAADDTHNAQVVLSGGTSATLNLTDATAGYDGGTVTFANRSITVAVTAKSTGATIQSRTCDNGVSVNTSGATTFNPGANKLKITVKSQAGTTKEYTITINVGEGDSSATLKKVTLTKGGVTKSIDINGSSQAEWSFRDIYQIDPTDKDGWKLSAEATSSVVKSVSIPNNGNLSGLISGNNPIKVTVTPQSGSAMEYTIIVYVAESKVDNSNKINTIKLFRGSEEIPITLDNGVYTATVDSEKADNLEVEAVAMDATSIVSINSKAGTAGTAREPITVSGDTTVLITVTPAGGGAEGSYRLLINLKGSGSSAKASFLFYLGANTSYDYKLVTPGEKEVNYSLLIPSSVPYVNVKVTPVSPGARIAIYTMTKDQIEILSYENNSMVDISAKDFTYIKIVVTSPDGSNTITYNFVVDPLTVNIKISVTGSDYFIDENEFYKKTSAFERNVNVDKTIYTYNVAISLPSEAIYTIELLSGELLKTDGGSETASDDTDLLKNYKFSLEDGLNVFVFRITDTTTNSEKICVLRVSRPIGASTNIGMLVALIIFVVLFVAAAVVMAVYIGKYVSAKKNGFRK